MTRFSRTAAARPISVVPVPYDMTLSLRLKGSTCTMVNLRKSIMLHVSVPVLSEKMYSIWPSSSTSDDERVSAGVSEKSWYMLRSLLMTCAMKILTISSDTYSEMGIRLLNRIRNVPKDETAKSVMFVSSSDTSMPVARYQLLRTRLRKMTAPTVEPKQMSSSVAKTYMICRLVTWSTRLILDALPLELRISFESLPVKTTTPMASGVLRSSAPRSRMLSAVMGIFSRPCFW